MALAAARRFVGVFDRQTLLFNPRFTTTTEKERRTMSQKKGDKARYNLQRRKKIVQRATMRALRASATAAEVPTAKGASVVKS
jgi:hypothetical protein